MASQPKAPAKAAQQHQPEPKIYHPPEAETLPEDAPYTPPPVRTIADEQRERSAEIQAQGVESWKAEHDERSEEDKKPHQVRGVAPPAPEGGSWQGSTRTTPPARAAQNPSASR